MAIGPRKTNRLLLLEVLMVLALVVLAIIFYLRPASSGELETKWWKWGMMAVLFFGAVGLHTLRRRRAALSALHQTIREEASKLE